MDIPFTFSQYSYPLNPSATLTFTLEEAQDQARFGDLETWSLRSSQGPVAIRQVYAELNGELPGGDR